MCVLIPATVAMFVAMNSPCSVTPVRAVVDRIEGNYAVVEVYNRTMNINKNDIAVEIFEGMEIPMTAIIGLYLEREGFEDV